MSEGNLEKLIERERSLIKQRNERDRVLEENRKILNVIEQDNLSLQQEIDNVVAENNLKNSHLLSQMEQLKLEIMEKERQLMQLEESQSEVLSLLQKEIQSLTQSLSSKSVERIEDASLNCTAIEEVELLKELSIKQQAFSDLQESVNCVTNSTMCIEQELNEIRENVKFAKVELKEAKDLLNHRHHELALVRSELHRLQRGTVCKPAADSLFNEVNDRRVESKEKLFDLKKMCAETERKKVDAQRQIMSLKQQQTELNAALATDPSRSANKYIKTYRDTLSAMEKVELEYKKLLCQIEELVEKGFPEDICGFYENLIKSTNKTRSRFKEIIFEEFLTNRQIYSDIDRNKEDLIKYDKEKQRSSSQMCELKLAIEEKKYALREEETSKNIDTCKNAVPDMEPAEKAVGEKKVHFAEEVVEPPKRRGGRVIECKTFYFATLAKKK